MPHEDGCEAEREKGNSRVVRDRVIGTNMIGFVKKILFFLCLLAFLVKKIWYLYTNINGFSIYNN